MRTSCTRGIGAKHAQGCEQSVCFHSDDAEGDVALAYPVAAERKRLIDLYRTAAAALIHWANTPALRIKAMKDSRPLLFDLLFDPIAYAEFLDPNVVRWSNVTFADNYYQTLGAFADNKFTITPNGEFKRDFDVNIQLNGRAGFTQDDFGSFGIGGPHSRVWKWYAGTVDLNLQEFARDRMFRSLADQGSVAHSAFVPTFKYNDRPWYASQEANVSNATTGYTNPESYVWEGIGEGWAFSLLGGVSLANQPGMIVLHPVTENNTEVLHGIDPAVPSIFNGNFEYGNLHPDARYPGLVTRDSLSTPGWSFHGGRIEAKSDSVVSDGTGDYAVELTTDQDASNTEITHNRLYIPKDATSLEFFYSVKDVERAAFPNIRTGQLSVFLAVGTEERFLGDVLFNSPEVLQETDPAAWHKRTLSLPQSLLQDQQGNRVDTVGTLTFRLSYPGEQAPRVSGVGKIWLDDIALVKQSGSRNFAPGAPLLAEEISHAEQPAQIVDSQSLDSVINAALSQWQGIGQSSVIVPPSGSGGVQLGLVQSPAVDFLVNMEDPHEGPESHGNAGLSEGGFDDQLLLENVIPGAMVARPNDWALGQGGGIVGNIFAHKLAINGNPAFASDGHAVQTESNAWLDRSQESFVVQAGFGHPFEAHQVIDGAFED